MSLCMLATCFMHCWDKTENGNLPGNLNLHQAVKEGSINHIQSLLDQGAQVNAKDKYGNTPLHVAVGAGQLDAVKILCEKGACLNTQNEYYYTPLYWAAFNHQPAIVDFLLQKGAALNPSACGKHNNYTLLHVAANRGHEAVVKTLLEKGVNPCIKDEYYVTPLKEATTQAHSEVARLLIQHGAGVNHQPHPQFSKSPLHWAVLAITKKEIMVHLMLELGASINAQDYEGKTALHHAAEEGYFKTVRILLVNGADWNIRNHMGKTPLDVARDNRDNLLGPEVIEILEDVQMNSLHSFMNRLTVAPSTIKNIR